MPVTVTVTVFVGVRVEVVVAPVIGSNKDNGISVGEGKLVGVKNNAANASCVNDRSSGVGVAV